MNNKFNLICMGLFILSLTACQSGEVGPPASVEKQEVIMMLDWVPNTNHTGIFVAQDRGYFHEAGLEVTIIEPGEVYAEQAVSGGAADFGISFQEQLTIARANGVPLVSIAAILQHNTSGFASRGDLDLASPREWGSRRYGAFGGPFEEPTLRVLMECDGGDFDKLEVVDTGFADPLALLSENQIDLAWIFYAWQGIQAEQEGIDLNLVMLADWFECIPDYYTPILITSETMIKEQPEVVRSFVGAITRGYEFAIGDPEAAAQILLDSAPELDTNLVNTSQVWISQQYQADAPRWGEQRVQIWEQYTAWMVENGIIQEPIDAQAAMTNEFLP
jgi:ABC-type nitrate/sulfonate/bicarbonate transport system substrate-binding protein